VSLRKIAGQVRGLRQMLEEHRHCLDEAQQANDHRRRARVALLILVRHLVAGIEFAADSTDVPGAAKDLMAA
jgi:DNA-binding FrmR family transcriptional regulator